MTARTQIRPWLRTASAVVTRLYRHRLGWILGHRFLQLDHHGRRSGREYHTVLEVLRHDRDRQEVVVVSGLGPTADWLRNVRAAGQARVHVGRCSYLATARLLSTDEAADVLRDYTRSHRLLRPVVYALLSRVLGHRYDGSPAALRQAARHLPMLALRPRSPVPPARYPDASRHRPDRRETDQRVLP